MGSQPIPSDDLRRVFDALRWIFRELRLSQNPGGQGNGPSAAQIFVLHVLKERGPLSMGELAEATATDPSSVSVVVNKLHQRGFVGKAANPGDRRRVKVTLAPAGLKEVERSPVPVQQLLRGRLEALSDAERKTLADLLERIVPPAADGHPAPMFFHEGASGGRR